MHTYFSEIARQTGKMSNIRSIGAIVAGDLVGPASERYGYRIQEEALRLGALLRPIGNTLYWLPPLTTEQDTIEKLAEITQASIENVYKKLT